MNERTRTKQQDRWLSEMNHELEEIRAQMAFNLRKHAVFPSDWHQIHRDAPIEPHREKVTVRLDADMLKWYRSLGRGWQPRMNAVLRAYMKAILSKEIEVVGDRSVMGKAL